MSEKNSYAEALARAKAKYKVVKQSGKNPFFKSQLHPQGSPYSTLQDIDEATSAALTSEGFAPVQCDIIQTDNGLFFFEGTLAHKDGGENSATIPLLFAKQDMQSLKGAVTYATRIVTVMLTGCVSGEADDDGNAAVDQKQEKTPDRSRQMAAGMTAENELRKAIADGDEAAAAKALAKVQLRAKRKEIDAGLAQRAQAAFDKAFEKEVANV